jgi:hypothetical protein
MIIYRVLTASVYRQSGILSVQIEELMDGVGPDLEVEGQPGKRLRYRAGRIVYDNGNVTNRRIIIIESPEFPIEELKGQRLLSKS